MTPIDLVPACAAVAELVRSVPDGRLVAPTPCAAYALGDLIDHVGGSAVAFTGAALKVAHGDGSAPGPSGDATRLGSDWRHRIPRHLTSLAEAWGRPEAWEGMTEVGGIHLPGEVAGAFALNEVVVHGWDLAMASGQAYEPDAKALAVLVEFLGPFAEPERSADREGLFGPVVSIHDGAPLLDRVLGLAGRDPAWATRIEA